MTLQSNFEAAADRVVTTTSGKVRGSLSCGVHVFKGIPYAETPTGLNRFMPPRRRLAWVGVFDADAFGPMAIQKEPLGGIYEKVLSGLAPAAPISTSEDCLVLNVWTPELGTETKRPVMVWLHPGSFYGWSGHSNWTDGANLAREREVVVVSLNHRLNVFGHLYLGDIGGPKYAESGNVGLLDIVAALTWVRENIGQFGGDSDCVTIFGESGGAAKVTMLMAMPPAKGLFHRAIAQGDSWIKTATHEEATINTLRILHRLGIGLHEIDLLHQVSSDQLMGALGSSFTLPVVAGASLPHQPFDPEAPLVSVDVPFLVGTNKDDMNYFTLFYEPDSWNELTVHSRLRECLSICGVDDALARQWIEVYRRLFPDASWRDVFAGICTNMFRDNAMIQAERKAALSGAPAYLYIFAWEAPGFGGMYGSSHTFEIPFIFENVDAAPQLYGATPDPRRYEFAATLSNAWAAFARNGDPNHPGLPHWRPYSTEDRPTMVLNYKSELACDPFAEERVAFAAFREARIQRISALPAQS